MKTRTIHGKKYKVVLTQGKPIAYPAKTDDKLLWELNGCYLNKIRIKITLGDPKTGKNWHEECDTTGTIGMSVGTKAKYPLLIANSRSTGGGLLMSDCIIKLADSKGNLIWKCKKYKPSTFEIRPSTQPGYTHSVYINNSLYSNHRTERSARLLISKMS